MPTTACKKKLYALNPKTPPRSVSTQRTSKCHRREPADPRSLERHVRQLLADKVSGNQVGIWLLVPEHLRLGSWELLCKWSGTQGPELEPRLALQIVHEAALCHTHMRAGRTLSQKGFELVNGLPFVASDQAVHDLLNARLIAHAQELQLALGKLRRASGHFQGQLLAVDPHRIKSYSKRQMRRHRSTSTAKPTKTAQCFFCIDAQTAQPIAFTLASAARTVTQATPELLELTAQILNLDPHRGPRPLVMADEEHYSAEFFDSVAHLNLDLLVPMKNSPHMSRRWKAIAPESFLRHWAGYALTKGPYSFAQRECFEIVQRTGECPQDYHLKGYLTTAKDRPEVPDLTAHYPQRWHVEEFFKFNQSLGWKRAGTFNLNIRYGQMTLALLAQTLIHQFRQRIGSPYHSWDADHMSRSVFGALEGDIRVVNDTIVVTYYNAPNAQLLKQHYQDLPAKLQAEGVDPAIPWLFGFKLDFRFK